MSGLLVLVTGTGRSGTSTMSGTLHHLGLYVPGPYLGANESNPRGFFESWWSVKFHNRLTHRAGVAITDSRPDAVERVQSVITPRDLQRLEKFLLKHSDVSDQIVVKDPRSVWTQRLWREAAANAGLEIRFVTMLRHPAEVLGSRTTYYSQAADDEVKARYFAISNLAGWINTSLISERQTRGQCRAYVRYTDLLEAWRPVAAKLRDDLGLYLNAALGPEHHEVDDFIEPALRRHAMTWEELDMPRELQEVAQGVWEQVNRLADSHGDDAAASLALDEWAVRFARVLVDADAISYDAHGEAIAAARRAGAADQRREASASDQRVMKESQLGGAATEGVQDLPVREVGGVDLIKVLAGRAHRRLFRRRISSAG